MDTMSTDTMGQDTVRADVNYVGDGMFATVTVELQNARHAQPGRWQECGFELQRHVSAVTDWNDRDQIAELHYDEISALAQQLTGCDYALVGNHISRTPEEARRHADHTPVRAVHSDFAPSYLDVIRERYRTPSPEGQASLDRAGATSDDVLRAKRLLILQFWRNTGPSKMDFPLGFCDTRSVADDAVMPLQVNDYGGSGVDFDTLLVRKPAQRSDHRWYYYPNMTADEVIVFRTFDTALAERGEHFWTPHSAFQDPDAAEGQPARRSIELRAVCVFM